ncbi:hypothetical protein [Arthrobacter zhaoguopingii]|uniref:hypothetical protein n=1 Tax=Arthrobacter zhaoguopingii TaxID=2681491 RepID=UPI0013582AEC|nr:hypothetical protein [Arthrobacter zhaoguopingii]
MKASRSICLIVAAALLLAGCGGQAEQAAPAPTETSETAASATPSAEATFESDEATVSLLDSCLSLFGTSAVAKDAEEFLLNVESLDADTASEAGVLAARLGEVGARAEPELAKPISELEGIFDEFTQAWDDRGRFQLDNGTYESATAGIKTTCTRELDAEPAAEPTPELTEEQLAEQAFLSRVRSVHPNLENFPDADVVAAARNFCLVYSKPGGDPVVDQLITGAAGAKYTLEELHSINQFGVTAFCPEHIPLLD